MTYPFPTTEPVRTDEVWAHMISQGQPGSTMKMVEGIPHVYRFMQHPEFHKAMARGVKFEVILTTPPHNKEEESMLEEITKYSASAQDLTEKDILLNTLDHNMQEAYKKGGVKAAAQHVHDSIRRDGGPVPYQECLSLANQMEQHLYGHTLRVKAKNLVKKVLGSK